ncbi:MAG: signal recognition particle receptor subunit alpha, partial [Planctomycetes bacterium]|nr:signal recognition particle receptor subunit alpha [Planctomycetota bacterium]
MFESLTERLTSSFASLRGRKELTAENIEEGLREVRQALLEADVHFNVAKDLVERVRERALGDDRIKGVDASEQFVHAFHQELV